MCSYPSSDRPTWVHAVGLVTYRRTQTQLSTIKFYFKPLTFLVKRDEKVELYVDVLQVNPIASIPKQKWFVCSIEIMLIRSIIRQLIYFQNDLFHPTLTSKVSCPFGGSTIFFCFIGNFVFFDRLGCFDMLYNVDVSVMGMMILTSSTKSVRNYVDWIVLTKLLNASLIFVAQYHLTTPHKDEPRSIQKFITFEVWSLGCLTRDSSFVLINFLWQKWGKWYEHNLYLNAVLENYFYARVLDI